MTASNLETKARNIRSIFALVFLAVVIIISGYSLTGAGGRSITFTGDENEFILANELWVLVSASLVFFMQAGFLCFEVGLARPHHAAAVAIKNIVDWGISTLAFAFIGFGLMFGTSAGGLFGTDLFALNGIGEVLILGGEGENLIIGPTFFLFQLAFAGTAITLVSGSLVERTTLLAYGVISLALGLVIYPVFGHWVWGNFVNAGNSAWLADLGFLDFAGGSVVHLLGAVVALVGIKMIGPRLGRFGPNGEPREMEASSIGFTLLGTVILWLGWWGFNGGSWLAFDINVVDTIILTNLAAVAGLMGAGLYSYLFQKRYQFSSKLISGALGGLVSITPGVNVVSFWGALATGLIAGIAVSWSSDFLLKLKIDDALGVFPIHGAAAIVGLITLPVFAKPEVRDALVGGIPRQVLIQLLGVAICIVWAGITSFCVYWLIKRFVGLRIDPVVEMTGPVIDGEWPYIDLDLVDSSGLDNSGTAAV